MVRLVPLSLFLSCFRSQTQGYFRFGIAIAAVTRSAGPSGPKMPKKSQKGRPGLSARSAKKVPKKSKKSQTSLFLALFRDFFDFFGTFLALRADRAGTTFLRLFWHFGPGTPCNWSLQSQKFWYTFCVFIVFEGFTVSLCSVPGLRDRNASVGAASPLFLAWHAIVHLHGWIRMIMILSCSVYGVCLANACCCHATPNA